MPKSDLVGCFYDGSVQQDGPDFEMQREVVRQWKKEGRGFFISNGRFFQLLNPPVSLERGISSKTAAVPFSRILSKLQKPTSVGYPVPAIADHRLRWRHAFMAMPNVEWAAQ